MFKIRRATFFITRGCNLRCSYCKVPSIRGIKILNTEQIFKSLDIIKDLGAEIVILFGGEPFTRPDLEKIIDYCDEINIYYALVSNSTLPLSFIPKLNYTASIDTDIIDNKDNVIKSIAGFKRLKELKGKVKDLSANIVIYKQNIDKIIPLVKKLNRAGFWSILELAHSGNEKYWIYRSNCPDILVKNKSKIKKLCDELLKMKKRGFKIHNSDSYLETLPDNLDLKWKCQEPYNLVIDEDGKLLTCQDFAGSKKFSIFDLPDKLENFRKQWKRDKSKCKGCFWSCQVRAHSKETSQHVKR